MYKNTGLKKKNAIDNSVDHTSTGTLVIVHPLQCNRVTLINLSYIFILFCLYSTNQRERDFQKIAKINSGKKTVSSIRKD